jgi:cyclic pyranopterin phosphate synthase
LQPPPPTADLYGRRLRNLRVSVTDRCNLRCSYCMPEGDYVWLPHADLLTFEEIDALVGIFTTAGVEAVRLTGGEPLLRRDLWRLVQQLAGQPAIRDLAMTTNGLLLAEQAASLRAAGLHRVTTSLDTLRPERFRLLARREGLERVCEGLVAVQRAGFRDTKIDMVVLRGQNDDETADLLEYGTRVGAEVRFIEYMDVGGATRWTMEQVVTREEILAGLTRRYGPIEALGDERRAPAERFVLRDGRVFGIVASTTAPFCGSCDRSRLTADGWWFHCLYALQGTDLRGPLRAGMPREEITARVQAGWQTRRDRGAEERLAAQGRGVFVPADGLRRDPHLEMHTRGG